MSKVSEAIMEAEKLNRLGEYEESNNILDRVECLVLREKEKLGPDDWAAMNIIFAMNYLRLARRSLENVNEMSGVSAEMRGVAGKILVEHFGPVIKKSCTGSL